MTLRTLNYGNYGILLIMGNAGFCPSAVLTTIRLWCKEDSDYQSRIPHEWRCSSLRLAIGLGDFGPCNAVNYFGFLGFKF